MKTKSKQFDNTICIRTDLLPKEHDETKCIEAPKTPAPPRRLKCLREDLYVPEIKQTNEQITLAILKATNKYRRMHCACRLVMNERLSRYAQYWADDLCSRDALETRPFPRHGENIICCLKREFDVERLMKLWYQEKFAYSHAYPKFDVYTGHFTQMVWWDTRELGVGIAQDKRRIWIVCNYRPFGNIEGHFKENVLPRKVMLSDSDEEKKIDRKPLTYRQQQRLLRPPPIHYCEFERRKCKANSDWLMEDKSSKFIKDFTPRIVEVEEEEEKEV